MATHHIITMISIWSKLIISTLISLWVWKLMIGYHVGDFYSVIIITTWRKSEKVQDKLLPPLITYREKVYNPLDTELMELSPV